MMKKNFNISVYKILCAISFGIALAFCAVDNVNAADSIMYWDETGNEHTCDSCIKLTEDVSSLGSGFYYVEGGRTITISGRINVNGIDNDGNETNLILCDGAKLIAEKGISVGSGKSLRIFAQSTDGSMGILEATGEDNQAGIGSDNDIEGGTVAIYGGDVTATGGILGAGIGGGNGGAGGNITINGGKVTANGGSYAAGIGGGMGGASGSIAISGGQVDVTGGSLGAGIGSGSHGVNQGEIAISGGQINAKGGNQAAGIGGGKGAVNADINIDNATIEAIGGNGAAGIGGGMKGGTDGGNSADNMPKEIIIGGGTVKAIGGNYGAGIGGGSNGDVGKIIITNGEIEATGGIRAAGIGGGDQRGGGEITIDGGKVTATGGDYGAGIGGGKDGDGGKVTINDGEVTVKGNGGGAGIGAGDGGTEGETHFNGGTVIDKDKKKSKDIDMDKDKDRDKVVSFEEDNSSNNSSDETEDDNDKSDSNQPAIILMQSFAGGEIGGLCTFEKQGPLCAAAFKAAMPAGFTEAFSFNLNLDSTGKTKVNFDKKHGKIVLNIPTQYQKEGRTFAVIGIDRLGKTKIFYDSDADDKIFTTNLDIEGYAFSLIYSDSVVNQNGKKKNTAESNNGTYVVKQGDSLSEIAKIVKKSVKYLAEMNGLDDIDKLSVDQVLKF
ncbi:MAG: LysM peptidoglycan-binding domain-containing protein [Lachnospiraceae bacterium]|nr:LysM peptidoglycan-binding domain-containing protein [Candidatus Colinaster equi]